MTTANSAEITEKVTFRIPAENLPALQAKLAHLNKRAAKLGCGSIGFHTTSTEEVLIVEAPDGNRSELPMSHKPGEGVRVLGTRTYHLIEVAGEAPKLNGWAFIATLQHVDDDEHNALTIVRTVPGVEADLTSYRTALPVCDHCKAARRRHDTYIVRHDDGRMAQVGSSCLKDFTGHANPEQVARFAEYLMSARDMLSAGEDEGFGGGGSGAPRTFWSENFLAVVNAASRSYGWLSRTKAREQDFAVATADRALSYLTDPKHRDRKIEVTDEDDQVAREAMAWADDRYRGDSADSASLSDYEWNLSVVTSSPTFSSREAGILASLLQTWRREVGRLIERKARLAERSSNEHFGTVGKREVFTLTVLGDPREIGSDQWGTSWLYKFLDPSGNEAIWFASSRPGHYEELPAQQIDGMCSICQRVDFTEKMTREQWEAMPPYLQSVNKPWMKLTDEHAAEHAKGGYGGGTPRAITVDEPNPQQLWVNDLEPGKTYRIKATVKSHGERDGIKQTQLTRATVVGEVEPAEDK